MKALLSFQERRILNILYALSVDKKFMTMNEIQTMNECSDRTVQSDLERIQDFWGEKINLETFENAVFLPHRSKGKLHQYIYDILLQSLHSNIILSVFFNPNQTIEFHAQNTHISTSHAQRTINDTNLFLAQHKLILSKSNGRLFLEGNSELNLRNFMAEFLNQNQPLLTCFKEEKIMETYSSILRKAFASQSIHMNELMLNQLSLAFYVSVIREQQGFKTIDQDHHFTDFDFEIDDHFQYSKEEIKAGLSHFNDFVFLYHENDALRQKINKHVQIFVEIDTFQDQKDNAEKIVEIVYLFMILKYYDMTKLTRLLDRTELFGKELIADQEAVFKDLFAGFEDYDTNYRNFLLKYMNQLIFWISLELNELDLPTKKSILVLSDLGESHALGLKNFLQTHFQNHTFDTVNTSQVRLEELINNYDLVISTNLLNFNTKVPFIEVNDYISQRDLARIFQAVR